MNPLEKLANKTMLTEGIFNSWDLAIDRDVKGNYQRRATTPEQIADLKRLMNDIAKAMEKDNPDYNISLFKKDFQDKLEQYLHSKEEGSFLLNPVPMNDHKTLTPVFDKHEYALYVNGAAVGDYVVQHTSISYNAEQGKAILLKFYKTTFTAVIVYTDTLMIGNYIKLGKKQKVSIKVMCCKY